MVLGQSGVIGILVQLLVEVGLRIDYEDVTTQHQPTEGLTVLVTQQLMVSGQSGEIGILAQLPVEEELRIGFEHVIAHCQSMVGQIVLALIQNSQIAILMAVLVNMKCYVVKR